MTNDRKAFIVQDRVSRYSFTAVTRALGLMLSVMLPAHASSTAFADQPVSLIGDDLSAWREGTGDWRVVGEARMDSDNHRRLVTEPGTGVMVNGPSGRTVNLFSRDDFGDVKVHVEFMLAEKSNSGIYFQGRYEIQIFDSYGVEQPGFIDCGAVYARGQRPHKYEGHAPRVNAARKPGQWQSFDIVFRAPRFDAQGRKTANACFEKVVHNGVVVHEDAVVTGPTTGAAYKEESDHGPIMLQGDHGPIAFRHIRITPITAASEQK